jgi:hypothetical protein
MAKQRFKPQKTGKKSKHTLQRAEERKAQPTPGQQSKAEELKKHNHLVRYQSGLVVLLALAVLAAGVELALLFSDLTASAPAAAVALRTLPPFLLGLCMAGDAPVFPLIERWSYDTLVVAVARFACVLVIRHAGAGAPWPLLCEAVCVALHCVRLQRLAASVPPVARVTWLLLRGVDAEPLKRVSVRSDAVSENIVTREKHRRTLC